MQGTSDLSSYHPLVASRHLTKIGWITVLGWICSTTSTTALVANIVTGLAIFNYPAYVPQRWHFTLLMWAATIVPFLINFWFQRVITALEAFGALCHVGVFSASIITLLLLAQRSTAEYVFQTLTNDISGWTNPAVAWGIGLLTVTYPLTGKFEPTGRTSYQQRSSIDATAGFDSVIHMSDEVKKARVQVPRSMINAVVLNAIMQFLYMMTVLFTIGDVDIVLADPLPILQVYYQATGSRAATNFFVSIITVLAMIAFFNCFASTSRLVWAFSRDNGLPFSPTFAKVHPRFKLPVNALILVAVCICLLSLLNIGSSTAFNAIISLVALALYISYFFPILFLCWRRLSTSHPTPIPWGPFRLGWAGPVINVAALCYIVFMLIWMPFPAFLPVDSVNMNYAGPITGAVILCAILDWCVSGRKRFQVPIARFGLD